MLENYQEIDVSRETLLISEKINKIIKRNFGIGN